MVRSRRHTACYITAEITVDYFEDHDARKSCRSIETLGELRLEVVHFKEAI